MLMAFTYALIISGIISIFMMGVLFNISCNRDVGPVFIIPLFATVLFMVAILTRIDTETVPIHSASVHQAIILCETNGGLKTLDQREAVCANGVAFNTRSLKQPEKQ